MKLFGLEDLTRRGAETTVFDLWPENVDAFRAFIELELCWVIGRAADGEMRISIEPSQIKCVLELMGVKRVKWPELFNDIREMQSEVIRFLYGDQK